MRTSIGIALLSAGLFSAQLGVAQNAPTAAPSRPTTTATCPVLDINCLTKVLQLTDDQVKSFQGIDRKYAGQCAGITSTKVGTSLMAQQISDLMKKRDAELRAALTREQSPKFDSAMSGCNPGKAVSPTTTAPTAK